ncbi:MAG: hypothetical protein KF894_00485 [Labilithrix sp.]|nr:hypothetical protein [Labilithrix sp.]
MKPLSSLTNEVTPIPGLPSTVVEIAAGARHACARTNTNEVWCWGDAHLGSVAAASRARRRATASGAP